MDFRSHVLLSLQRALWGMVTPELASVAVGWGDKTINVRFVYDCLITDTIRDIVSEVEAEVIADFAPDVMTQFTIERKVAGPLEYRDGEAWWAYVRREPTSE